MAAVIVRLSNAELNKAVLDWIEKFKPFAKDGTVHFVVPKLTEEQTLGGWKEEDVVYVEVRGY